MQVMEILTPILVILGCIIPLICGAYLENRKKREYAKKQKELDDLVSGDTDSVQRRLDAILRASDNHPSREQDS